MPQAKTANVRRPCIVCGESQYRRKVWERKGSGKNEKVLCFACAGQWSMWIDGSAYSRVYGPDERQKAMLRNYGAQQESH